MTPDPKYTASLLLANCATGNPLPGPVNLSAPRWVGREVEDLNGKKNVGCSAVRRLGAWW